MTYALALILWTAAGQTPGQPAPAPAAAHADVPAAAPPAVPSTVIVECAPSDSERVLRAQLDEARAQLEEARAQLAKTKEESRLPDNAVAALLLSDRPQLASLRRLSQREVGRGPQRIRFDVYGSMRKDETLAAVVVSLKNPRDEEAWEPTEARVSVPFGPKTFASFGLRAPWFPPQAVAVRSAPERILPGQSARVAVVFDKADLEEANGPVKISLRRDGKSDLELELDPSEVWPEAESGR